MLGVHGLTRPGQATPFGPWSAAEMTTLFFDYLRRGRMNVARLTSRTVSPVDAVHVYETLLAGPTGDIGIVFDWTEIGDPRI